MDNILLHKENKKLEFVNDLILESSYKQSNDELLNTALKKISEIMDIDFGYIANYTEKEVTVRNVEGKYNLPDGILEEVTNYRFKSNEIIENMRNKVLVISEEDFETLQQKYISKKYNFKTLITVPIGFNGTSATKLILLFSSKEKKDLLRYVPLLETIGNTLWMLLQKQRIYEDYHHSIVRTEKLRALGELAGGIAHDFNNLLTTILGFSQIALTHELSDDIKIYMDIIYKSALDGKKIVERIQSFNRKKFDEKRDVYLINSIVESGIEMAKPRWKNFYESYGNNLSIIRELNSHSKIFCVEHEIREVIINLLSNAMDAMEDGGTLTIRTYDEEDKAVVEIGDTGPGIPEEIQKEIFEPFYSTKGAKGTGLGLSIVKDIINGHEGSIQLESKTGEGSIFRLYFNKYIGDKVSIEMPGSDTCVKPNMDTKLNILVVDDIQQVGDTIVQMLKAIGINADIETESVKVIHRLSEKNYDIIICDLAMPEINGIDLSVLVKKQYPKTKFILITGWPGKFKNEGYDSVDSILRKPLTIEELVQAINDVL